MDCKLPKFPSGDLNLFPSRFYHYTIKYFIRPLSQYIAPQKTVSLVPKLQQCHQSLLSCHTLQTQSAFATYTCMLSSLIPRPFPHQYLITYSIQIRNGKAWEIWSRAVTSGTWRVDTRGVVPDKESQVLSCTINPSAGGQSFSKAVSILVIVHVTKDHSTRHDNYCCWALPPMCLPFFYLTSLWNAH